jgi:hypothetical protein
MGESKAITCFVAAGIWSSKGVVRVQSNFCVTSEPLYERHLLLLVVAAVDAAAHKPSRRLCA